MAITVTATGTSSGTNGSTIKVFVVTGGVEGGGSSGGSAGSVAAAPTWTHTPTFSSSKIIECIYDQTGGSSGEYTPNANNTFVDNSIQHDAFCDGSWTGTVTAGSAITTMGASAPSADKQSMASYEVRAAVVGVTPLIDASTPAVAISATNVAVSPAFTPPSGSVLVACMTNNNAGTITPADSSGLVWTSRQVSSGGGGIAAIYTATVPSYSPLPQPGGRTWQRRHHRLQQWIPRPLIPKIETLIDDFSVNRLATLWAGTVGTVTWSPGSVTVKSDTLYDSDLATAQFYDLSGSAIYIRVNPYVATSSDIQFGLAADASNSMFCGFGGSNNWHVFKTIAGVQTNLDSVTYNAATMAWWRIRESAGTTFFDTAPDVGGSPGVFTNQFNTPTSTFTFGVTKLTVSLLGGDFGTDPAGTTAVHAVNTSVAPALSVRSAFGANSGASVSLTSTGVITLPTWQPGDMMAILVRAGLSGETITQTAGSTFALTSSTSNSGGFTTCIATRIMQLGDTAPTFGMSGSGSWEYQAASVMNNYGGTVNLDVISAATVNTTLGNTATVPASTAAGWNELSLAFTGARHNATGACTVTYTPPTGWTTPAGGTDTYSDASNTARFASVAVQTPVDSGTITPGSETLTDSASGTWTFNTYQVLLTSSSVTAGLATATGTALAAAPAIAVTLASPQVTLLYAGTGGGGVAETVTASTAAGDAIAVWMNTSGLTTGVTDSAGNTYVQVSNDGTHFTSLYVATYKGSPGTPTAALTAGVSTITASGGSAAMLAAGVHGVNSQAVDASPAFVFQTTGTPSGPATGTLSQPGDVVLAGYLGSTGMTVSSWGGGFSQIGSVSTGGGVTYAAWLLAPSKTSVTPSATLGSSVATDGHAVALSPVAPFGLATATGAALDATGTGSGGTTVTAGLATATGTALAATVAIGVNAGLATATGAALAAAPAIGVNAGLATATGTALAATPAIAVTAGLATATGTALAATAAINVTATAGLATGTGAALAATVAIGVTSFLVTATGTARNAAPAIGVTAGLAIATGTALNATATPAVAPAAGLATATGTALAAAPAIGVNAGLAIATGTALAAAPAIAVTAGLATATGTALLPLIGGVVSPAITVSGFGSFPQVPVGSIIIAVIANITQHGSNANVTAPQYQLWDGTSAQIGAAQNGTASTAVGNVDSVVFTGVSYSQLATLQLQVYGTSNSGNSGATVSVDAVSLSVEWIPNTNANAPATLLAVVPQVNVANASGVINQTATATLLAVTPTVFAASGVANATAAPGDFLAVIPQFPPVTVSVVANQTATATLLAIVPVVFAASGVANATATPSTLQVTPQFPPVTVSVVINQTATASLLAVVPVVFAASGVANATAPAGTLAVVPQFPPVTVSVVANQTATASLLAVVPAFPAIIDVTAPGWAGGETDGGWANPGNITGSPDGNYAVWTVP